MVLFLEPRLVRGLLVRLKRTVEREFGLLGAIVWPCAMKYLQPEALETAQPIRLIALSDFLAFVQMRKTDNRFGGGY